MGRRLYFGYNRTHNIHRIDPITHRLRDEVKPGEFERIAFDDMCRVVVVE